MIQKTWTAADLALDRFFDRGVVDARHERAHGAAIGGRRGDDRQIAQSRHREVQRARDRCGGQREHVDLRLRLLDALLVRDAEALLLVDHEQAEILEAHVGRQQAMRADDASSLPSLSFGSSRSVALRLEARQLAELDAEAFEALVHRAEVLLDEHRGRREHAACLPPCTARKIARIATSVLP